MDERNKRERDLRLVEEERDDFNEREADQEYDREYREETAAEVAPDARLTDTAADNDGEADYTEDATEGKGLGAIAVALAIVSLFFLPVILGAAAIVMGFITRAKGHAGLGYTAIGIGAFSIIISLFLSPFF
ncbi:MULTISPECIES: DUF308 domain-containing protein [Alteribacter]|uniref:DUF308 domain-containing protein n=1 Tax=Alteribacter keqinensis TaxID=2483800 RepID=A0A3M7TTY3_9BACI|nr:MULTISPECIES: DUF308 domain-containing protein [Alteribacter]MBM7097068.1 DUF308 domain-containing protein [Alteribacter salitolerans]RNA68903.1 DUF308 domain-containing protein [Alteribacter keqinensis]